MNTRNRIIVVCMVSAALGACSKPANEQAKKPMTTAERDSAIAASKLPGAGAVGKALEVADTAEARANAQDSQN